MQKCVCSQSMSKYCMIYFGYSSIKGFRFLEQIIYKKSDIKNLTYCYCFMDYHLTFYKKEKMGSPDKLSCRRAKVVPTATNLEDNSIKKFKECIFCHLYNSIFLVRSNFALQEEKKKKKNITICY